MIFVYNGTRSGSVRVYITVEGRLLAHHVISLGMHFGQYLLIIRALQTGLRDVGSYVGMHGNEFLE